MLSVDNGLRMFLDAFQGCFSFYLDDGRMPADTLRIVTLDVGAPFRNYDHPFLPLGNTSDSDDFRISSGELLWRKNREHKVFTPSESIDG